VFPSKLVMNMSFLVLRNEENSYWCSELVRHKEVHNIGAVGNVFQPFCLFKERQLYRLY